MIRWTRWLAAPALATTLTLAVPPAPVLAQEQPAPGAEEEASEGRPLDGYLATTALVCLAMFIACKSARRL